MSLGTLILSIAIVAVILTAVVGFLFRKVNNWPLSFLQNFAGALFIFSGWVKAMDPLGTAYKMQQYFAEFETTFAGSKASFLAPLFPWLENYVNGFSVTMIVLEIVLGLMLVIGANRRLASWLFFLIVAFFTVLTGFTYLTGYVPEGVNFFEFGKWGPYVETNMKVTDCGCFGDFIKLKPRTTFLKDVFLLFPSVIFLLMHKKMHQVFNTSTRTLITIVSTIALIVYCFSNYIWDIPHTDFRPFKEGVNIWEQKQLEGDAQENVKILAYKLTNKNDGKVVELPYDQFLKEFKKYSKEEWEYEQIKSEPTIKRTKISDFDVSDPQGMSVNEEILTYSGYTYMIVAYDLHTKVALETVMVKDTSYVVDTVEVDGEQQLVQRIDAVTDKQEEQEVYSWEEGYLERWKDIVNPKLKAAAAEGAKVYALTAYVAPDMVRAFQEATASNYPFYVGDDILLKTIVRSNPGIVLMKDGTIIKKWHFRKFPEFDKIKAEYYK